MPEHSTLPQEIRFFMEEASLDKRDRKILSRRRRSRSIQTSIRRMVCPPSVTEKARTSPT